MTATIAGNGYTVPRRLLQLPQQPRQVHFRATIRSTSRNCRIRSANQLTLTEDTMDYRSIITINPDRRFGKPCVRDTRITVFDVLSWLAAGMDHGEILEDFPQLTDEDIRACLAFAAEREQTLKRAT
jgi:uncharacterized protein (DUF433 family)